MTEKMTDKLTYSGKMNRLYIPDHNHIFRKLSRMSSGDFPRLPGLKYDDIIRNNGPKSDQTNRKKLNGSGPIPSYAVFRGVARRGIDFSISLILELF